MTYGGTARLPVRARTQSEPRLVAAAIACFVPAWKAAGIGPAGSLR
jgi:hypothetical protein